MAKKRDVIERFLEKINKEGTMHPSMGRCWEWTASLKKSNGGYYGMFYPTHGKQVPAHRFSYEVFKGKITEGNVIDHLCNNPKCVNPEHLKECSHKENILRGGNAAAVYAMRTHCNKGHEFTLENTRITKAGARKCRICRREESRKEKQLLKK